MRENTLVFKCFGLEKKAGN